MVPEVMGPFDCFDRVSTEPQPQRVWVWKNRAMVSQHSELYWVECNEQAKFSSWSKRRRNRVSEFLRACAYHLGHLDVK